MKKIAVVAGLAVLSTTAFATKARMQALGQDVDQGSFFLSDSRGVFANAATVNEYKNFIVAELGTARHTTTATGDTVGQNDDTSTPNAEGGFFKDAGSFVYGVYLGYERTSDTAAPGIIDFNADGVTTTAGTDFAEFLNEGDRVDFFFGGDAGVQWGVNIGYAHRSDETGDGSGSNVIGTAVGAEFSQSYDAISTNFGVIMGDMAAYLNLEITEDAEGNSANGIAADTYDGDLGWQLGASWAKGDMVYYGEIEQDGFEAFVENTGTEYQETTVVVGAAEINEVNEKSRWFWDLSFEMKNTETTQNTNQLETDDNRLQLTVGFETDVKSWLTLRGSVAQHVLYSADNQLTTTQTTAVGNDDTEFNTTSVAGGATLRMGDLSIDGVLGIGDGSSANAATTNGRTGLGDQMFARTAFVYNF